MCYAADPQSLVIRANGDINKCTVALDNENNRVGRLEENGEITFDVERFDLWMEGHYTGNAHWVKCPYEFVKDMPTSAKYRSIPITAVQ